MSREDLIPAGEVLKVHGLEGGLVLRFDEPFCPLETLPSFVFLEIDGLPVPFPVEEAEEFGECSYLFFFEDVTGRDQALRYRGARVLLERKYLPGEGGSSPTVLKDYRFTDLTTGREGTVTGFMDIPGNPLFEVETGSNTFLIPAGEEQIESIDHEKKRIVFRLPEGIFDPEML